MENVPGILTMRKGEAINEIIQEFSEIGYNVSKPFLLKAEEFGAPQKRRRVFLVGSLKSVFLDSPTALFSDTCLDLPKPITVGEAIFGLPKLISGEGETEIESSYNSTSYYEKFLMGEINFQDFYSACIKGLEFSHVKVC
jgi:DNA (cytosine-5)-methyltransferase 1